VQARLNQVCKDEKEYQMGYKNHIKPASIPVLLALLLVSASFTTAAAPKAVLWERWQANDPRSTATVNHEEWSRFLGLYLATGGPEDVSTVAYAKVTAGDKSRLDAYIASLEAARVSALDPAEQFAYWINLYNAGTVQLILNKYPVKSIRDIKLGGLFSSGPWDAKLFTVEGEALSLNDIEHRILRPIWKDPRIHYAVNCASFSCPNLQATAFTAGNLEALLEQSARSYINSTRGVAFSSGRLTLSSIYDWYGYDFGRNEAEVVAHLRQYAKPELAGQLAAYKGRINYAYDWSLNEPRR
jgi:hypothetical protein